MSEPQVDRPKVAFASTASTAMFVMCGSFLQLANVPPPPPNFRSELLASAATRQTQFARENREAPWQDFLDQTTMPKGPFSPAQVGAARDAWRRLSATLGEQLPLPATRPTGEGMLLQWATPKGTADIVIADDGTHSWFARSRITGQFWGSEDNVTEVHAEFIGALRTLLA